MGAARASPANAWSEPRLGRLCEVAAAAISPGRRERSLSASSRSCVGDEAADTSERDGPEIRVVEVDAFASVHDMIHAAIASYGKQATLREIYKACQLRGRIAYKRSGGSRLITHNDHWKSQIRHALYTCDRFSRAVDAHDLWTVSPAFSKARPQTTKVLIRTDPDAASVNDDSADAQRRQGKPASRQTRSKHSLEEPLLQATPRQKRSRTARVAAKTASPGSSVATRSRADFLENHSGSMAFSNGQNNVRTASEFSDMGDRSASAFQPCSHDASTPGQQHEGEDESSHNDAAMPQQIYLHDGVPTSFEPGIVVQPSGVVHHSCASLPVVDVHPYFTECLDAHQIVASASEVHSQLPLQSSNLNTHTNQPFVFAPHHASLLYSPPSMHHYQRTPRPQQQPNQHSLSRSLSAEAESPAETQVYALRSRLAPRVLAEPSGLQRAPGHLQKPEHRVHHFFTCHSGQPGQAPQASPASSHQRSIRGDSAILSSTPESPMNRAAVRQGDHGKPPALPRSGRTQLLLAAARKAQTAAFPIADPYSCETADQPVASQGITAPERPSPVRTLNHSSNGKVLQGGSPGRGSNVSPDSVTGRLLRRRFLSSDAAQ